MALNDGRLPRGLSALVEQRAGAKEPDVLAVERLRNGVKDNDGGGLATLEHPVATITTNEIYASRANRVVIRHHLGRIVAVVEILSPGNKSSKPALREFVDKTIDFLRMGIHVLLVDLFPPSPRDRFGIHQVVWNEMVDEDFAFPTGKDRIVVSYEAGDSKVAYIEPVAVGDTLPDMKLCVGNGVYVPVPLDSTYLSAWYACPEALRSAVETGEVPDPDADE
jgi:hypothetical protein